MVKLQNKTESGETIKNRIEKLLDETDPANGLKDAGETIDIAQKNNEEPSNKVLQATRFAYCLPK